MSKGSGGWPTNSGATATWAMDATKLHRHGNIIDGISSGLMEHLMSPIASVLLCCTAARKPHDMSSPSGRRRTEAYPAGELTSSDVVNLSDIRDVPPAELERLGSPPPPQTTVEMVARPPGMGEFPRPRH